MWFIASSTFLTSLTDIIFSKYSVFQSLLSASLNGMLTNTVSPWFILKFRNEIISQDDEANEWLESYYGWP